MARISLVFIALIICVCASMTHVSSTVDFPWGGTNPLLIALIFQCIVITMVVLGAIVTVVELIKKAFDL